MFNPEGEGKAAKEKVYIASQTRKNFDLLVSRIQDKDEDLTWGDLFRQALPFMHEAAIHEKWARILLWAAEHDGENYKGKVLWYHPSKNRKLREELLRDLMTQAGMWIKDKADMLSDMGWKRGMQWETTGRRATGLLRTVEGE